MSGESVVQVSPSGGGPKIRTYQVTTQQPDGSFITTEMQVVNLANPDGSLVNFDTDPTLLADLLRVTNALLRILVLQGSMLSSPRLESLDTANFMSDEVFATR